MDFHARHARFIYNLGVEQFSFAARYRPYRVGKRQGWPSQKERDSQLTEARAASPWLKAGSQVVQQQALNDLNQAYSNWWNRPDHFRRPTYRKADRSVNFRVVGREFRLRKINNDWAQIYVPKGGWVKFRLTRTFAEIAAARSCRFTRDSSGRWHVTIPAPQPAINREPTGAILGIDRGVTNTIADSDGNFTHIPGLTVGEQRRLLNLERQLARRHRGSNRRNRTKASKARLHARLTDRRVNWVEQHTTRLVTDHDVIAVENLPIRNMTRSAKGTTEQPGVNVAAKAALNQAILASSWGRWLTRLEAKAAASGVAVIKVSPINTSRTCADCGHVAKESRENQASFTCVACGHQAHADTNAAINILDRGITKLGFAHGRGVTGQGDLGTSRSTNCQTLNTATPEQPDQAA